MRLASVLLLAATLAGTAFAAPRAPDGAAAADSALRADPMLRARSALGTAQPLLLDLFLGRPGAERALEAWLSANPTAPAEHRSGVWLLLCEERHRRMRYREAILACRSADAIRPNASGGFPGFFGPLQDVPPARWSVSGLEVPLVKDADGTRRLRIDHPSGPLDAIVDTGAEVAVMSDSVARRLGARRLGTGESATTTTPVTGEVAVVDLVIGGARLSNLPVLVLPDAQLILPDGTSLPTILSLGALVAPGRAAFLDHGTRLALGDAVPRPASTAVPLYWDPSGIGFAAGFARGERAVHLDTGSGRTYLFPAALASLSREETATRTPYERRIAGIGGVRVEQATRFDRVTLRVGGQPWTVAPIEMAPEDAEGESARIGAAIMDRFRNVILDFERMAMFVE